MLLIHGGRVLRAGSFAIESLDIVVEGDTIRDLVPRGSVTDGSMTRIDATDRLLIPGLVNGHNHAQTTLGKGVFDRATLELYLNTVPWSAARRTVEDKYLSAILGAAEMVRKGCTAAYDMFAEFPLPTVDGVNAVAQAYADVGMRATVAPMMADRSFYEAIPGLLDFLPEPLRGDAARIKFAPHEESIAACRKILNGWGHSYDRIRPALGPTIPHHCSDSFLVACRDLAREMDIGMQMHIAESKMQAIVAQKVYGKTLVAHVESLGLLGPQFCVSHGVWLDDDDRARIAGRGASISHNPGSNLKLGSGMADMRGMLDRGINVAIGTDGASSSDNLNVFEAMRTASNLSRVQDRPVEQWITSREVLRAATEGGARALGFERIGRIEIGYKADVVFLDLASLNYTPLNDAVNQLVFCEDGTAVDSVMIGGRLVLEHGRHTTIDLPALRRQAQAAVERLAAINAESRAMCDRLEPYVGQFCGGLSASPYHVHRFCGAAH
ncbi:MAG: amidohydrolase family protein [Burkholderiales bacterium]